MNFGRKSRMGLPWNGLLGILIVMIVTLSIIPPAEALVKSRFKSAVRSIKKAVSPPAPPPPPPPPCRPSCQGDRCGQSNGCGGTCPSDDKRSCGKCGNAACCTQRTWYRDNDGDGYGNPSQTTSSCNQPGGTVNNANDCYDSNANIKPGAAEQCNNVDDNCDGKIDQFTSTEGCEQRGACAGSQKACISGRWTSCSKSPGTETCNNVDDNCNGQTDEGGVCCTPKTTCQGPTSWSGTCTSGKQTGSCSDGCSGTLTQVTYCREDFSQNYCVGMEDFNMFQQAFNGADAKYDLVKNGKVDLDDFFKFADVYGSGCSSPQPQLTSAPAVSLSASSTSINLGSDITLSWSVHGLYPFPSNGINSCAISGDWSKTNIKGSGSERLLPSSTGQKSYTIRCFGISGDLIDSKSVTVRVNCVDNGVRNWGSCDAPAPTCGQTTNGFRYATDNCGVQRKEACTKTGGQCSRPPSAPTLVSVPGPVHSNSQLTATASGSADPDGNSITYHYKFARGSAVLKDYSAANTYACTAANCPVGSGITAYAKAHDGGMYSGEKSSIIQISNTAPVAENVNANVNEDAATNIALSCSDPDGSAIVSYTIVSQPSNGRITSSSGNKKTYDPQANFNGRDSFTYKCSDGSAESNTATANIYVNGVNDAPSAKILNAPYSGTANEPIQISGEGSDPDGDSVTYQWAVQSGCSVANPSAASTTVTCSQGTSHQLTLAVRDSNNAASSPVTATVIATAKPTADMDKIGTCKVGQSITLKCGATSGNVQAAKVWAGQCSAADCFNTRSWVTNSGKRYYGTNAELTGADMDYDATERIYKKSLTIGQSDGTAIAATCRVQGSTGVWSDFSDDYPVCVIGGCQSIPSFSTPTATPPYANAETDVFITFTADRDLKENPRVKVRKTRGTEAQQYDAVFARKDARTYFYRFRIEQSYTAGSYSIDVEGTDNNNCKGRANGVLVIRPNARFLINGEERSSYTFRVPFGQPANLNLQWVSNIDLRIILERKDSGAKWDVTQGVANARPIDARVVADVGNVITGATLLNDFGIAPGNYRVEGVDPATGQPVYGTDLTVTDADEPAPAATQPAQTGALVPSGKAIRVKMDATIGKHQLYEFYFTNSWSRGWGCGVRAIEEDGGFLGRRDESDEFIAPPGGLVKKSAGSLNAAIKSQCSRHDNACTVINTLFGISMSNKCGDCRLSVSNTLYQPTADIVCGNDNNWYLCDRYNQNKILTAGGKAFKCNNGEWTPVEICGNGVDDGDGDNLADCADLNCYSGRFEDISRFNNEIVGSHRINPNSDERAYYHPSCNPDSNSYTCTASGSPQLSFVKPAYSFSEFVISSRRCCGDDIDEGAGSSQKDEGFVSNNALCHKLGNSWRWSSASSNEGKVFGVNGLQYVSDRSEWWYCDGVSFKKYSDRSISRNSLKIKNREYLCGDSSAQNAAAQTEGSGGSRQPSGSTTESGSTSQGGVKGVLV